MNGSGTHQGDDRLGVYIATALQKLLDKKGVAERIEISPAADICSCLELFLPRILRDRFPEWATESLDGIWVAGATKTGPTTAQLVGTAILISDQAVTPFLLELDAAAGPNPVLRLKLGEPGTGPLGISGPPANSKDAQRLLASIVDRIDSVAWSYVLEGDTG